MPNVKLLISNSKVSPSTYGSSNKPLPVGPPAVAFTSTPKVANSVAKIRQSLIR